MSLTEVVSSPEAVPDGLVVDIGGTKVMVAAVRSGHILDVRSLLTQELGGPDGIVSAIARAGARLALAAGFEPEAVAVAVPGLLDRNAGVVVRAANLPFVDYPLAAELRARLGGAPVTIEHDANCGVLGEAMSGAAKGLANVVYLTVSTGIGVGTLIDGRLLNGAHGAAGEVGHAPVTPSGLICVCGSRGCLEAYASGRAIAGFGHEVLARSQSPVLASVVTGPGPVTARDVVAAAEMGDAVCAGIVTTAVDFLVMAVQVLLRTLDPDVLLLGGGVMANSFITGRVIAGVQAQGDEASRVRSALLGPRSVLSGAVCFLPTAGAQSSR